MAITEIESKIRVVALIANHVWPADPVPATSTILDTLNYYGLTIVATSAGLDNGTGTVPIVLQHSDTPNPDDFIDVPPEGLIGGPIVLDAGEDAVEVQYVGYSFKKRYIRLFRPGGAGTGLYAAAAIPWWPDSVPSTAEFL